MAFFPAQRKPLVIGLGFIVAAALVIVTVWAGSYLPGFAGEIFSMLAGIMWTPVLLDTALFVLGFALILGLNLYRRKREGDEYVYLEQVEGPDIPADMPVESRSAVFAEAPEPVADRAAIAAIEGALELGDLESATESLLRLPEDDLDEPEILALRIRLARKGRREDDQQKLLARLRLKCPHHPLCSGRE